MAKSFCLDAEGRPQFYNLLRKRAATAFYVFDVLWLDGEDLRSRPLMERKRILRGIVPDSHRMLYARHIDRDWRDFYRLACEQGLEGIVAKLKHGAYGEGWFKIRNLLYSQYERRRDFLNGSGDASA